MSGLRRVHKKLAFTLIEALAVVALIAIVLPVALYGISMSTHAASLVSQRAMAARIAADKLTEMVVTSQAESGDAAGDIDVPPLVYHWTFHTQTWTPPVPGNLFSGASQNTVQTNQTGGANQANQTSQTTQSNIVQMDVQVSWMAPNGQHSISVSSLYYEGAEGMLP